MQVGMDCTMRRLKQENDLEEDPLAAGCEKWNEKKPRAESSLLKVKMEDGRISNERSEQAAFEEMKDDSEIASGITKAKSPCEDHGATAPENGGVLLPTKRQLFRDVHCSETFKYKKTLKEHEREHREEPQFLTCDMCHRQFSVRKSLVRHIRWHMNKAGRKTKLHCQTCGKEFKNPSYLVSHLPIHMGEKPYVCDHCGKRFMLRYGLNEHHRKHTGERPYSCSICNKQLAHRIKHEGTHSDRKTVQCKECGKTLLSKEYLKLHMRCHTGVKPHKYSYCDKTFARSRTRKKREVTHTEEYLYSCAQCGKGYNEKRYFIKHKLSHRNRKPAVKCKRRGSFSEGDFNGMCHKALLWIIFVLRAVIYLFLSSLRIIFHLSGFCFIISLISIFFCILMM